ncbi:MAG: Ger(x)C family spore germination protein [Paenibacillaceae bacterium]|nr:Ger(x)C family spore germination protein [Paenibacillaceae bacterium]
MISRRIGAALLALLLPPLAAGCWDRIEIDRHSFVTGIAVDAVTPAMRDERVNTDPGRYHATYQIIIPAGLKNMPGVGGTTGDNAFFNIGASEDAMPSLAARMALKLSRPPYFEHLKLIVVSDEVAQQVNEFPNVLDYYLRNSKMRRDVDVLVSQGNAEQTLSIRPLNEKTPVEQLQTTYNMHTSSFMVKPSRIGDVHEFFLKKKSFAMQSIKKLGNDSTFGGAALYNGTEQRLVGFLTGEMTQGLNLLLGTLQGGIIETTMKGDVIDMSIERAKRTLRAVIPKAGTDDPVRFTFRITVEGAVEKSADQIDLNEKANIRAMEERFQKRLDEVLRLTMRTLQARKTDAVGLGTRLDQRHYRYWKQIRTRWEPELFPKAECSFDIRVILRHNGNINRERHAE